MEQSVSKSSTSRFALPEAWLDAGDVRAASDLIAASADLALFLDMNGVIRDVAVGAEDLPVDDVRSWIGNAWIDLVTPESRDKVAKLVDEASKNRVAKWREINMRQEETTGLPLRFVGMKIGQKGIVAIGRDLRGLARLQQKLIDLQRSMDRQYGRLRNAETRYRVLFQMSAEAVMIADAGSGRITEANAAAAALVGVSAQRMPSKVLFDLFVADGELASAVLAARSAGRSDPVRLKPAGGGEPLVATLSSYRQDGAVHLLVRLAPEAANAADAPATGSRRILDMVKSLPEAFVVIDTDRRVVDANDTFLQLAELATVEQARGQRLDRWLGRPGVDVDLIVSNLREHGSLRDFTSILRGEYDAQEDVEVTGVAVPGGPMPCYGLIIRTLEHRSPLVLPRESDLSRSVAHMADLVGRVALKDLVRETTDIVEQMCIQTALNLTGDNRASAAQILGLSRQGLYAKLRRYGMGESESDGADADTNSADD